MRNFIESKKLLPIIDFLEDFFGYQIESAPLNGLDAVNNVCGVQRDNGKWRFLFLHNEPPSQINICHELLHLCLIAEGWPSMKMEANLLHPICSYCLSILATLPQHVIVWARGNELGFSESENWTKETQSVLIPEISRSPSPDPHIPETWQDAYYALRLSQALLSPARNTVKQNLKNSARCWRPDILGRAQDFCNVLLAALPSLPSAIAHATGNLSAIVQIPPESLLFLPPVDRQTNWKHLKATF